MKKFLLLLIILGAAYYWGTQLAAPPAVPNPTQRTVAVADAGMPTWADVREQYRRFTAFHDAFEAHLDRSRFTPSDDIPLLLRQAVVATEDRRFYEHGAVDLMSIARAAMNNYQAGETLEGGSTITQQVIKNVLLSDERTWLRKGQEILLASQMERVYTKDEILDIYLNTIYYGSGAYGIGDAARIYFDTTPSRLTLAQCAMLAGIPQAPSARNPFSDYQGAKERQRTVLTLMVRQGMISPSTADAAYAQELRLASAP